VGREKIITDLGSRRKAPDTTIGEEEGDHNGDRETLRTPLTKFFSDKIMTRRRRSGSAIPASMRRSPETVTEAFSR